MRIPMLLKCSHTWIELHAELGIAEAPLAEGVLIISETKTQAASAAKAAEAAIAALATVASAAAAILRI